MTKQLSFSLKKFFWLKKKIRVEARFESQSKLTYFHHSTCKACFVILPPKRAFIGVTWIEHLIWAGREWTPCLGECNFPLGLGAELPWGTASQSHALACSLPGRWPPGRGWQPPPPSMGFYLSQSAFSLPIWPWQQPGEAGPEGHVILGPQRRKGKLTQAGGGRPRLEPAVITQPLWTCWSPWPGAPASGSFYSLPDRLFSPALGLSTSSCGWDSEAK